jgi:hypothetical protein
VDTIGLEATGRIGPGGLPRDQVPVSLANRHILHPGEVIATLSCHRHGPPWIRQLDRDRVVLRRPQGKSATAVRSGHGTDVSMKLDVGNGFQIHVNSCNGGSSEDPNATYRLPADINRAGVSNGRQFGGGSACVRGKLLNFAVSVPQ